MADLDQMDDEELVQLTSAEGGSRAVEALVVRHWPGALSQLTWHARSAGLPPQDREDLRQDGFLALLKAITDFDPARAGPRPGAFRAYLTLQLTSCFRHFLRRGWRERGLRKRAAAWFGLPAPGAGVISTLRRGPRHGEGTRDPAEQAASRELWESLEQALGRLKARDRWVVDQWVDGRSLGAIACRLGWSYYRLRKRFRRALIRLRAQLWEWAEP